MAKIALDKIKYIKCDCILLDSENVECKALSELQCAKRGNCSFYKSNKEYHIDGSKRKYPIY